VRGKRKVNRYHERAEIKWRYRNIMWQNVLPEEVNKVQNSWRGFAGIKDGG
jgi:hypothetical protein